MEMVEVKGRLALGEEKLLLTQDELKMTKEELKMTKEGLKMTKDELEMTKEELKAKYVQLEMEMMSTKDDLKAKEVQLERDLLTTRDDLKSNGVCIQDLEREVSFLKDPPFTFACGAHYDILSITSQAISYTILLYSSTNIEGPHGLDISTGVFTSGHPGSYTATWSLLAQDNAGDPSVLIYLRKNGEYIEESRHYSVYTGPSGFVDDVGGRTLILHLDRGDTLDLYCDNCSADIYHITFCVSLSQFDVE